MARNKYDIDERLDVPFSWKNLSSVMTYIGRVKGRMSVALLLSAVGSVVGLTGPLILQKVMDEVIPSRNMEALVRMTILFALTIVVNVGFNAIRTIIVTQAGQQIIHDIRQDVFAHLQKLPFSYYDNRPHGKILVRVISYVNSISDILSNGVLNFIIELINIVFIAIFMFRVSMPLASITVAGLVFVAAFIFYIKPRQRRAWQRVSDKNSNLNAYVQESIQGSRVTQIFDRQKKNVGILRRLSRMRRIAWMKAIVVSNSVWVFTESMSQIVFTLVYIAGVYLISPMATFGVLLAMATYANRFWQPLINLANIYNNFINSVAYLERIFETINEPVLIEDAPHARPLPPVKGKVDFTHVSFSYDASRPILTDVSFSVSPGESIAVVGPTGAGKTTILSLISRFYNVQEGSICIDGHDLMDVTLESLRSQMGIMLQDSFLFSGTIADNIRYGRLDASDAEVERVATMLQADAFIRNLPDGYHTVVKEGGRGLSQGERQLIAFARTLLADPRILVLDEATSSIDSRTEELLQRGISILLEGRTSFIVAHRLSTVRSCTRIMYVHGGKILETGSHDELMALRGHYWRLHTVQMKELAAHGKI
ncbi:ABC transporter ATP-binding protein [Parasphaerochaeta coccoides]|uniref:Xenobiotic-transporting ATPase n=1 Tax=Parasphaerochaeta coccoides (strain ATCC BAA-1237 / DSM 17374 / SPN1) TaxID=760011 RepID=F4GIX0_PARC1|nr:ABC transporter ATP-binding protein [Parasphaerochaeta coccoides]AEC02738.1 Xenobiotic-transporting ATPase [Parasphaerochaeta coccoides DSM 17374]